MVHIKIQSPITLYKTLQHALPGSWNQYEAAHLAEAKTSYLELGKKHQMRLLYLSTGRRVVVMFSPEIPKLR